MSNYACTPFSFEGIDTATGSRCLHVLFCCLAACQSDKAAADLGLRNAATGEGIAAKTSIGPSALADTTNWQDEFYSSLEQTQADIADVRGKMNGLVSV